MHSNAYYPIKIQIWEPTKSDILISTALVASKLLHPSCWQLAYTGAKHFHSTIHTCDLTAYHLQYPNPHIIFKMNPTTQHQVMPSAVIRSFETLLADKKAKSYVSLFWSWFHHVTAFEIIFHVIEYNAHQKVTGSWNLQPLVPGTWSTTWKRSCRLTWKEFNLLKNSIHISWYIYSAT